MGRRRNSPALFAFRLQFLFESLNHRRHFVADLPGIGGTLVQEKFPKTVQRLAGTFQIEIDVAQRQVSKGETGIEAETAVLLDLLSR